MYRITTRNLGLSLTATKLADPPDQTASTLSALDAERTSSNHIIRYRMLETEVHRVLYLGTDVVDVTGSTLETWLLNINARLQNWYEQAQAYKSYNMLEFQNVQYYHLKARIYRPTPRLKTKIANDWAIVLECCRVSEKQLCRC